jgi:hypothetical protein
MKMKSCKLNLYLLRLLLFHGAEALLMPRFSTFPTHRRATSDADESIAPEASNFTSSNFDCTTLYSLQWTPDEIISKPVRDVWKWKDGILGDGRDFFVPKPKTISKLQHILLSQVPGLKEISVLSNCARLELLCVWEENSSYPSTDTRLLDVSSCLLNQVDFHAARQKPIFFPLTQSMDMPNVLCDDQRNNGDQRNDDGKMALELSQHWSCFESLPDILWHMCDISAGMAARPRRPDRRTIFRPFSSRDAHILLQLKRTKEVTVGRGTLNRILEYALRAGKAARNPERVESLNLLKSYGDGSSKYSSSDPPLELSEQVKQDVLDQAIKPLIQECLDKIATSKRNLVNSSYCSIQDFRQEAEAMAITPEESRLVKRLLHKPTIEFRKDPRGLLVDQVLESIMIELEELRQQQTNVG